MLPKLKILSKKYFEYNVNGAELPVAIGMEGLYFWKIVIYFFELLETINQ